MTITGTVAGVTIDGDDTSRVFLVNTGVVATLDRLTISGGSSVGGILDLPNSFGGGVLNLGTLAITNSTIAHNSTGGFANGGGVANVGTVAVTNSIIRNNSAGGLGGFGLGAGGGVFNFAGTMTVTGSTISNNAAGLGGGVGNALGATMTVTSSTIADNSAQTFGGVGNSGTLAVTHSTITNNTAETDGGGVGNDGTLTLTGSTISNNTAAGFGGGVANVSIRTDSGTLTVIGSTIADNTANLGGGVVNVGGTVTLTGSILAGNTATTDPDFFANVGAVASSSFNLIGIAGTSGLTNGTNNNLVGSVASPLDPRLGPLQDNGGPTQTMALLPDSPAINAGTGTDPDQRGFGPVGRRDIGAFEAVPVALVVDTAADEDDGDYSTGDLSLREAIALANRFPDANTITFDTAGVFATAQTITLSGTQLSLTEDMTITGSAAGVTVDGNDSSRVFDVSAGVTASLDGLTITGGNAVGSVGGGIRNSGSLSVTASTIAGNTADVGGGIRNFGSLSVTASTIAGNTASSGGGIRNESGILTVTASTIAGNTASTGGGISNGGSGTLTVTASTVAGNTATSSSGGGILNFGTLTVTASTVAGNMAISSSGGGISNGGTLTLGGSLVLGNSARTDIDISGPIDTDQDFNLVGLPTGLTLADVLAVDGAGRPLLGDFGGPTQTIPLASGSPAIDAGTGTGPDQRGIGPVGTRDIGAFESRGFTLTATGGTPQAADADTAFADPLEVTVTPNDPGVPVGGVTVTFTAPGAGASAALSSPTAVTDSSGVASVTATAGLIAGSYTVTATAPGVTGTAVFELTNDPLAQAITFNPPSPVNYGVAPILMVAAGGGSMNLVEFTVISGPGTLNGSVLAVTGAGAIVIQATQPGNATYTPADPVERTITVNQAVLTVTGDDATRPFGQPNPPLTATITGFVNGENLATSGVTGSPELSTTATDASPVGDYPITAAIGSLVADNYTFMPVGGTLTVGPAEQTITFTLPGPVSYGVTPITMTAIASSGLPVSYTVVSGPGSLDGGVLTVTGAGEIVVEATQPGGGNFLPAEPVRQTLVVDKAVLTVTGDDAARPFGQPNPPLTATTTGFVNGETLGTSGVTGVPDVTTPAAPVSPAGDYPVSPAFGTLDAANYSFAFADGTLTVTPAGTTAGLTAPGIAYGGPAAITVTVTGGGATPVGEVVMSGLPGGPLTARLVGGVATFAPGVLPAGTFALTAAYAGTPDFGPAVATGSLTVTPAVLTVTALDATRPGGTPNPSFGFALAGFVAGDGPGVVTGRPGFATTATPAVGPGTYPVVPLPGTLRAANYTFAFAPGILTVTAVDLLAAGAGAGGGPAVKVYDEGGAVVHSFFAYDPSFTGGVAVATGRPDGGRRRRHRDRGRARRRAARQGLRRGDRGRDRQLLRLRELRPGRCLGGRRRRGRGRCERHRDRGRVRRWAACQGVPVPGPGRDGELLRVWCRVHGRGAGGRSRPRRGRGGRGRRR